MPRYLFHLSYLGTHYQGWQRQKNAAQSVQQVLESVLAEVLGVPVALVACGRTDAGVHASQFLAHADLDRAIDLSKVLVINRRLPEDIALYEIREVGPEFHARFSAVARSYDYFIHFNKDPYLSTVSTYIPGSMADYDLVAMQGCLDLMKRYDDFRVLCQQPDKQKHTRCTISQAQLFVHQDRQAVRFYFTANRFLKAMIRLTVARILEVGLGKASVSDFESYLRDLKVPTFQNLAYPQGLHLSGIKYPNVDLEQKCVGFLQLSAPQNWLPILSD